MRRRVEKENKIFVLILGENQEQLRLNFTRVENVKKLTCKTRNTIGQSEATVNVDILCKRERRFPLK
jgi:hypothetical protein